MHESFDCFKEVSKYKNDITNKEKNCTISVWAIILPFFLLFLNQCMNFCFTMLLKKYWFVI